jgi:hypothetical protein
LGVSSDAMCGETMERGKKKGDEQRNKEENL